MKEQLLKQIEYELLTEIKQTLNSKDSGNDLVTGLYTMHLVSESIESYKNKLLEQKHSLGMSEEELNELMDEASINILPKIMGE